MSDTSIEEQENGLFFILNMLLASFQQRDFFDQNDEAGLIVQIYHVFDMWLELHLPVKERTCRSKGCFSCCYNNPNGITTFDLWVLYIKERQSLTRQSQKIKTRYVAYKEQYHSDRETHQIRWIQTQTPCPFLEQGSCSIYEHRPLACRSHFSVKKPEYCHPKHPNFMTLSHKQRTLPPQLYKKLFQDKNHPQDFLGACLWLFEEIEKNTTLTIK
jgi:Fe-S-cluster containining protein